MQIPDASKAFSFRVRVAGSPAKGLEWRTNRSLALDSCIEQQGTWTYTPNPSLSAVLSAPNTSASDSASSTVSQSPSSSSPDFSDGLEGFFTFTFTVK
jgi:hypothetical protein